MQVINRPLHEILTELKAKLEPLTKRPKGSQTAVSKATGVPQYTIHRIMKKKRVRLSESVEKLCKYAGVKLTGKARHPSDNEELMKALAKVWNGSDDDAKALAAVIETLDRLRE